MMQGGFKMDYAEMIKKLKDKINKAAGDYIAEPLGEAGYPNLGAGVAAGVSALDTYIPDTLEDAALNVATGPIGGKIAKGVQKMGLTEKGKRAAELMRQNSATDKIKDAQGNINKKSFMETFKSYGATDDDLREMASKFDEQLLHNATKTQAYSSAPVKATNSMENAEALHRTEAIQRLKGK